jgi:hypothetical protein
MAVKRKPAKTRATKPRAKPRATRKLLRAITDELEALREQVAELSRLAEETDEVEDAAEVFAEEMRLLVGDAAPDPAAVRRAARLAVAEQAWAQRLGTLLETRDVVALLDVSKQRVSALARDRRLIALPHGGRVSFPAWQFATTDARDRECIATAHAMLTDQGAVSPWTAASWFGEQHPGLDGKDPVAFLRAGGDRRRVLDVAAQDAARLAQ